MSDQERVRASTLDEFDDDFPTNDVIQNVEDSYESGDSDADEMRTPGIFTTKDGPRRVFVVQKLQRASGGFRPSFLFEGSIVEITTDAAGGAESSTSIDTGLILSLRYEPPSPKFKRQCPALSSYRLKLSKGNEFLYLLRGLPKLVEIDTAALALRWGSLELAFTCVLELNTMLTAVRHVELTEQPLWPAGSVRLWARGSGGAALNVDDVPSTSGADSSSSSSAGGLVAALEARASKALAALQAYMPAAWGTGSAASESSWVPAAFGLSAAAVALGAFGLYRWSRT